MKRWCMAFAATAALLMLIGGGITAAVDPYFHYHKPLEGLSYRIYEERYQNDGIGKHFDYDAIITGTSMTQNFKTSELGELFGYNAVKLPFAGASYREIGGNLRRALEANPGVGMVVWGLDYNAFFLDADLMNYESYPEYLYDNHMLNDVRYLFNKSVLFDAVYNNVILYTEKGGRTTSFDEYNNWDAYYEYGREAVLSQHARQPKQERLPAVRLDPKNLEENVISVIKENPQTEFYLFFTPYSIVYWDQLSQAGALQNQLTMEAEAVKLLLACENVQLYSFFDEFDMITDLDNYKDSGHYGEDVNSYILKCMSEGSHRLTEGNYGDYHRKVWDFYTTYDYEAIYE